MKPFSCRPALSSLVTALMLGFAFGCAQSSFAVVKRTQLVPMSDGIRLETDLYLPDGPGPWPVLLMRTPYPKAAPNFANDGQNYTKKGWVFIAQDTRGRFNSEGANFAFEADGWAANHDGTDTVAWIAAQPWCNGKIATGGASALGITQLFLAGAGSPPLATQHITVGTPSLYDAAYRQGVFRRATMEDWVKASGFDPGTLRLWTSHSAYDDFWAKRNLEGRYHLVDVPALHYGGWFDIFAQGTLNAFTGYNEQGGPRARGHQRLLMGPWTHATGQEKAGQLTFPLANKAPTRARHLSAWINQTVLGADEGIAAEPPVIYYVMGDTTDPKAPGNFWRKTDRWPRADATPTAFYLQANHVLGRDIPAGDGSLAYDYNPADPAPTVGGPWLTLPPGPMDQAKVEARPDVLIFTTEPLAAPMEVTGRITARLWISSDAPDTDFFVRLCIIGADQKSYNIAEGAIRARFWKTLREENLLKPGEVYPLEIDLWSTSIVFNQGNRLRVQVTSSSAPGHEVNPNTGAALKAPTEPRTAHNTIHLSAQYPSQILLPVAPYQPAQP